MGKIVLKTVERNSKLNREDVRKAVENAFQNHDKSDDKNAPALRQKIAKDDATKAA